jgi:hypothetical protein
LESPGILLGDQRPDGEHRVRCPHTIPPGLLGTWKWQRRPSVRTDTAAPALDPATMTLELPARIAFYYDMVTEAGL